MSKEKTVRMRVLRTYSRGNVRHHPGKVIHVPEHVAKAMERARPPYGERVEEAAAKAEEASTPKAQAKPTSAGK